PASSVSSAGLFISHEGIGPPLGGDVRRRTVSREQLRVLRQRVDLRADRPLEFLHRTTGKIRAADAASKNRIANKRGPERREMEEHVALAMSRHVPHPD